MNAPGLYVAKSLKVATTYPMTETAGEVRASGPLFTKGVPGGTVVATDGTSPIHAVLRFVAKPDAQLWHRCSNQSLFMPSDLFCTHVVFYAVDARSAHSVQLTRTVLDNLPIINVYRLNLESEAPNIEEKEEVDRISTTLRILPHPGFIPICHESCRKLREDECSFMTGPPTVQALRVKQWALCGETQTRTCARTRHTCRKAC